MMGKQPARVSEVGLSIQRAVKENPGIHFRGLARAAQVTSAGQLRHHLDRLQDRGVVIEVEDGRYKRFFHAGDHDPGLRAEMARFARVVPRRIAKLLLVHPMNRTQLRRGLGCADSTLGYHLTRMVTMGDLSRVRGPHSCLYSLTSREQVSKILILQGAHRPVAAAADAIAASADDIPNPLRPVPKPPMDPPSPAPPAKPDPSPRPRPEPEPAPAPSPEPSPRPEPMPMPEPAPPQPGPDPSIGFDLPDPNAGPGGLGPA